VLVVRDHGPARPDIVEQQIHTFNVCNPTCTTCRCRTRRPAEEADLAGEWVKKTPSSRPTKVGSPALLPKRAVTS